MDTRSDWDKHVELHDLFCPAWQQLDKGSAISLVVDGVLYTDEMALGVTYPGDQQVRIYGDVSSQVRGCRRLTILNALVDWRPPLLGLASDGY